MKLFAINWRPTPKQLRQFSVLCAVLLPLVGWLWDANGFVLKCLAGTGLLIAVVGFAAPAVVKPIFLLITLVTAPIGIVVGELTMLVIYFGVFLPIGLTFRAMGRDALQREFDYNRKSYWEAKKQPRDITSYYRQS